MHSVYVLPTEPFRLARIGTDPGMNTNISAEYKKSKYVRISIWNNKFLYSSLKCTLVSGQCFTDSFNMVISGMKKKFYT